MSVRTIRNLGGVILAGGLLFVFGGAGGALGQDAPVQQTAQNSSVVPDAQIESNVLKALASVPALSTQNILTSTVYGTVTVTGNVHDEALRTQAENLIARVAGVKKVVDELTLGDTPAQQASQNDEQPGASQDNQQVLQSNGTYPPVQNGMAQNGMAQSQDDGQVAQNGAMPPQQGPPASGHQPMNQPMDQNYGSQQNGTPVSGGQLAGMEVTVPPGAMLRVRIDRGLDSNHIQPGTDFDGTVLADVVADGAVAIPRGATVTGTVVDARKAGTFKGKGELALQIDSLSLGGGVYPLTTEVWARNGRDKTAGTVNNTVGLGVVGAFLGAVAGGGAGAAIGAGVGAGAGLAGSAASPRGQVIIPPESVLTFRTSAPVVVRTVSEREMQRLSYAAGPQRPQGPPPYDY